MRAFALLVALASCTRATPDRVGPAPETKPSIAPPTPEPALVFSDVRCTYGGTAPAFFVWAETTATVEVIGLRAKSFELRTPGGGFTSGAAKDVELRTRPKANGEGHPSPLDGGIARGAKIHLEVFGALALAPFGSGATYPTEDRAFRVELQSSQGTFVVEGTCVVGPAG